MPCGECKWWEPDEGLVRWDGFGDCNFQVPGDLPDALCMMQTYCDEGIDCPQFTPREEPK